ncbi:MAG: hypothetical protein JJP05_08745 [cyanobacterium endosymbiont of Rhopalodia gibba]
MFYLIFSETRTWVGEVGDRFGIEIGATENREIIRGDAASEEDSCDRWILDH